MVWPSLFLPRDGVRAGDGALLERVRSPRVYESKDSIPRVGGIFSNGYRSLATFESTDWLFLDFDRSASCSAVAEAFGDSYGFAHTTWTHTTVAPRTRAGVRLSRSVDVEEQPRVWRFAAITAERAGLTPDYAASSPAHVFALPAMRDGYAHIELTGAFLDVDYALATIPEPTTCDRSQDAAVYSRGDDVARRMDRARRYLEKCEPAISGSFGHRAMFRAALVACRGFDLDEDDALNVLAEYNERAQPPFSRRELLHKVRSASTRARVAPGWLVNAKRSA